jgi:hypothetical protein
MFDDESKRQGADGFEDGSGGRAYSLIAPNCQGASDTTLHELGHNIGAVNPNAPHDSGDWHCYSFQDVMCYEDGGPYFEGGGQMIGHCAQSPYWVFDCRKDDYWNPRRPTTGYFATHWNTADSPFLSTPRHR